MGVTRRASASPVSGMLASDAAAADDAAASSSAPAAPPARKSLWRAYLAWATGWWFGAHLWYLERHAHAVLYMFTFYGVFTAAVLDGLLMPYYVWQANGGGRGTADAPAPPPSALSRLLVWLRDKAKLATFLVVTLFLFQLWRAGMGTVAAEVASTAVGSCALLIGRGTVGRPSYWTVAAVTLAFSMIRVSDTEAGVPGDAAWMRWTWYAKFVGGSCRARLPDAAPATGRLGRAVRMTLMVATLAAFWTSMHYVPVKGDDGRVSNMAAEVGHLGVYLRNTGETMYRMGWRKVLDQVVLVFNDEESLALKTLELEKGATFAEVKKAFRALSREHHPDAGGSVEKQQEINKAFAFLKDVCGGFFFRFYFIIFYFILFFYLFPLAGSQ